MSRATVLAVVSDLHCGGTTALCPDRIELDDGGFYTPSKAQSWLWWCWNEYWTQVAVTAKAHKARLVQIFNGDLVEGDHHRTTQIMSGNPNAQAAVVNAAMAVPLALKPAAIYIVRGTGAHVGNSASAEERIADGLRRDKRPIVGDEETGTASHWHARLDFSGVRVDVAHHGRTGFREHTRSAAATYYANDIFLGHAKDGDPHPHLAFRGHHHRFNDSYDAAPTRVITTGCWQLSTEFGHKVAADTLPDFGGAIVVIRDEHYTVEKIEFKGERPWRAA